MLKEPENGHIGAGLKLSGGGDWLPAWSGSNSKIGEEVAEQGDVGYSHNPTAEMIITLSAPAQC